MNIPFRRDRPSNPNNCVHPASQYLRIAILKVVLIATLTVCLCWPSLSLGQRSPNRIAGDHIANGLLMGLANPKSTNFRVGILNTAAEVGVLISPNGALPVVEHFRGYSSDQQSNWNLSWSVREQLDSNAESLSIEIIRKRIARRGCAQLEEAVNGFYTELENVLQARVLLTQIPPERPLGEVTVDGTSFIVQIWTGERTLVIGPDQDIDKALHNASFELMRVISGCSDDLSGEIEEHRVW